MKRSSLIFIVNISIILLIFFIGLAVQVAPYFTCSLLSICIVTFLYILTEQWTTHDAVEFENRFWTLMGFVLAYICLFCKDSPLQLSEDRPGFAWLVVFLFSFLVHNYDRHLHRRALSKTTNIRRIRSTEFGEENRSNAQRKVLELRKLVQVIDHTWMSSTFLNLFLLPRVLYIEHQIITIIAEANADELNLIISNVECALLFYKIKDHRIYRRFNRTRLLKILAMERISELNVPSRVVVLDGLMRMKLSAHAQSEQFVKNIIVTTKTDDLSELKSLTDSKGDVNSMHKLLYTDIRNTSIKESILKYIAQQASIQAAHSAIGSRRGKKRNMLAWRKILSDVDDTVTCSGGSWPAGVDSSFPKKALYPGVLAFYRELDLGSAGSDDWDSTSRVGNLVFLSARPHVYKSVSESVTYSKFRYLQQERGLYTSPTLLAGSLDTGSKFVVRGDSEPLALKKFENFKEYLTLYPEYTCIFIGDNGQGDVRCAEMVLEDQCFSEYMHRVYIHQVQPKHLTYCSSPKTTIRHPRVYYFSTYIDAAIDAHRNNLIRATGLRKIMLEAIDDFERIPTPDWTNGSTLVSMSLSGQQKVTTTAEPEIRDFKQITLQTVNASAKHIRFSLKAVGNDMFFDNSKKRSTFIASGNQKLKTGALLEEELSPASMGYSRGGAMVKFLSTSTAQTNGERKKELRLRELNVDIERGNAILTGIGIEAVPLLHHECRHHIGSVVNTMFGEGIITGFRSFDGIYEVQVGGWNGDSNINKQSNIQSNYNIDTKAKTDDEQEGSISEEIIKNNYHCRGGSMIYKLFIAGVAIHC